MEAKDLQEKKNIADFICECVQFHTAMVFLGDPKYPTIKFIPKGMCASYERDEDKTNCVR